MSEVPPRPATKCRGCPRVFDEPEEDLCQAENCGYCRRCHATVYGTPLPHEFNQEEFLRR